LIIFGSYAVQTNSFVVMVLKSWYLLPGLQFDFDESCSC